MEEVINIVLIDDHKLFREGIKKILDFEQEFRIVAEGDDGSEALELVKQHEPDIVLMDINMPEMNGVEATAKLIEQYPNVHDIILSIHYDENYVTYALKKVAYIYLVKDIDTD